MLGMKTCYLPKLSNLFNFIADLEIPSTVLGFSVLYELNPTFLAVLASVTGLDVSIVEETATAASAGGGTPDTPLS